MNKEDEDKLAKLGITSIPGRKGPSDRIYFWNGRQITFTEFGTMYAELHKNETRNYPRGKGGKYARPIDLRIYRRRARSIRLSCAKHRS